MKLIIIACLVWFLAGALTYRALDMLDHQIAEENRV